MVQKRFRVGHSAHFSFLFRNAGSSTDTIDLQGCTNTESFKMTFVIDGIDVSGAIRGSPGMDAGSFAPDTGGEVSMTVETKNRAESGDHYRCWFDVYSVGASSYDTAFAKLILR